MSRVYMKHGNIDFVLLYYLVQNRAAFTRRQTDSLCLPVPSR